ncbi:MAG: hypothetical protein WCH84_06240 [Verrucomicrobiota bacterium]
MQPLLCLRWRFPLAASLLLATLPLRAVDDYPPGPDSQPQPGVPQGVVTKHEWRSTIYPGTTRPYWVYVPAQYTSDKPANVMVFQDGAAYANEAGKIYAGAEGEIRAPVVFDNLIHQGKLPVTMTSFTVAHFFQSRSAGSGVKAI